MVGKGSGTEQWRRDRGGRRAGGAFEATGADRHAPHILPCARVRPQVGLRRATRRARLGNDGSHGRARHGRPARRPARKGKQACACGGRGGRRASVRGLAVHPRVASLPPAGGRPWGFGKGREGIGRAAGLGVAGGYRDQAPAQRRARAGEPRTRATRERAADSGRQARSQRGGHRAPAHRRARAGRASGGRGAGRQRAVKRAVTARRRNAVRGQGRRASERAAGTWARHGQGWPPARRRARARRGWQKASCRGLV